MLLSAVYEQTRPAGRGKGGDGERHCIAARLDLANVALPPRNASPVFIAANEWIRQAYLAAGLPER